MSDQTDQEMNTGPLERLAAVQHELDLLRRQMAEETRLVTLGLASATLSHELRNILTPVMGYAQIALASPDDHELGQTALQKTMEGIEAARAILESTLEFCLASDNPADLQVNVREAAEQAIRFLARDAETARVPVEVSVPPTLLARMQPVSLQQILINLLLNALAAMRSQRGSIQIRGRAIAEGGVEIDVSDTGPGVAGEVAETLFDPFVTTRQGGGGTGLGLAVCKRLVEQVGGTIRVASTPGQGATFTIRLEASPADLAVAS